MAPSVRTGPRPHTLRPTMIASVAAATTSTPNQADPAAVAALTMLSIPVCATPSPVTSTISPDNSVGRAPRSRTRKRDSTISSDDATRSRPATAASPPVRAAMTDPGT